MAVARKSLGFAPFRSFTQGQSLVRHNAADFFDLSLRIRHGEDHVETAIGMRNAFAHSKSQFHATGAQEGSISRARYSDLGSFAEVRQSLTSNSRAA
jgi:hypothetical protein